MRSAPSRVEVVLFADRFNRKFEPETLEAALEVLVAGGYRVHLPQPRTARRAFVCGRTHPLTGQSTGAARTRRAREALAPCAWRGVPIIGLEPSCLFTLRDEIPSLATGDSAKKIAAKAVILEEFLMTEA